MQKNIFHTSVVRLVSTVANFLLVFLVARYLGPNAKGIASLLLTTVSFVVFFSSIIGGQSYIFLIPKLKFETLVIPAVLWSFLISVCAFLMLSFLNLSDMKGAMFIAVIALLMALNNILTTLFLSKQRWNHFNLLQALPVLLTLLFTVLLFFVVDYKKLDGYIYSMILSYCISFCIGLWFLRHEWVLGSISQVFEEIETLFRFGLSYQLLDLLQLLNLRFYFFMLHHLQGNIDLGYFSVGVSLFESCWIFARSVQAVTYSKFVSNTLSKDTAIAVIQYVKFSIFTSLFISLVLLLLPDTFYMLIFGKAYVGVNWSLKWFIPGVIGYNVYLILQSYFLAKAKYSVLILFNIIGFLLALAGCYAWIPMRFFSGASAAASLSFLFTAGAIYWLYCYENKLPLSIIIPQKKDASAFKNAFLFLLTKRTAE